MHVTRLPATCVFVLSSSPLHMLLFAKRVTRTILQQLLTEIQLTLTRGQVVLIIFVTLSQESHTQTVREGIKRLVNAFLEQFGVDTFFCRNFIIN